MGNAAGTLRTSQWNLPRGVAGKRRDIGRNREPFGTEKRRKDLSDQLRPQMAGGVSARGEPPSGPSAIAVEPAEDQVHAEAADRGWRQSRRSRGWPPSPRHPRATLACTQAARHPSACFPHHWTPSATTGSSLGIEDCRWRAIHLPSPQTKATKNTITPYSTHLGGLSRP